MDEVWERSSAGLSGRGENVAGGAVRVHLAGGASPAPTTEKAKARGPRLDSLIHDLAAGLRCGRETSSPPQFGHWRFISVAQRTQNVHSKEQMKASLIVRENFFAALTFGAHLERHRLARLLRSE